MKKAFIQLHIAVFLAGFTGILGKLISLDEVMLVWYRLLISAGTMWLLFSFGKHIGKISSRDKLKISGIGLIAALHWVTFYGSIKFSNVSVALVCFSSVGFFTSFFEPLFLKRKLIWQEVMLGVLVMAGIYVIFHFDPRYKTGIILGVLSAILGSLFPIFNREMMQRMSAVTLMTYELTGGLITFSLLLPFYARFFPPRSIFPSPSDWGWLLVLSWICSVWAFQLSANALKKISAFTVNLSYNLEPVYGIILAFLVFKENKLLHESFYFGLFMIMLAVSLQTLRVYRKKSFPGYDF